MLVSENYWEIFSLGDFLPYTFGNLPCYWDSVVRYSASAILPAIRYPTKTYIARDQYSIYYVMNFVLFKKAKVPGNGNGNTAIP